MNTKKIKRKLYNNADRIASVFAIVGLATTVVLAIKETRKAIHIVDEAAEEIEAIHHECEEKEWPVEEETKAIREVQAGTIKDLVLNYAPTIVGFVTTSACIIGSNRISRNRNAALTGSLNAANLMYQEYREHVRKAIGEKKETEIHDTIRKKHMENVPLPVEQKIVNTGKGDTLCFIEIEPGIKDAGIYFLSSPEAVHAAVNEANAEGLTTGYVSLADFLYFLGLKVTYSGATMCGWRVESSNDFISIRESSHIHSSGRPVLDISFWQQPYYGFDRFG